MFADEAMTEANGWSWWEQPRETWPYQAEVTTSDPRYVEYYNGCFSWMQAWMPAPTAAEVSA
jgi:hypothetical protein